MNKADSNTISSYLEEAGYSPVSTAEQADVIVLNSCIVRKSAEDKILNKLAALKALKRIHPDVLIVLTGCLIGSSSDELQQRFPHVDLIYFDVKFGDPEIHRRYTGKSNRRIFGNLRRLLGERPQVVHPRIPLIPGITATRVSSVTITAPLHE